MLTILLGGQSMIPGTAAVSEPNPVASGAVPNPVVSGPVTGGRGVPFFSSPFSLSPYGYVEEEYFVSGTASAHGRNAPPARYTTRILVWRPTDPRRFNGTTIAEWLNVSAQLDAAPDWLWGHPQVLSDGFAYVVMSAQQAGVCGAGLTGAPPVPGLPVSVCTPLSLKGYDPVRYEPLVHPGDEYSFDIFSQALQAVRHPQGVDPMGGLPVERVIAAGQSQSALRLDDYLQNGADRAAQLVDAFLSDADLGQTLQGPFRVPVLQLWSEESIRPVATTSAPNHVIWPVVGSSHVDAWITAYIPGLARRGILGEPQTPAGSDEATQRRAGNYGQEGLNPASLTCVGGNEFPRHYAVDAAFVALEHWIRTGEPAPAPSPAAFTSSGQLARDPDGNAIGGLRLPPISVPVASYHGDTCQLFGISIPFTAERLRQLYPTHADYVAAMQAATDQAVAERYLTPADAIDLMTRASESQVPNL